MRNKFMVKVGATAQMVEYQWSPKHSMQEGETYIVVEVMSHGSGVDNYIKVKTLDGKYIDWWFPSELFKVSKHATAQLPLPLRFMSESKLPF